MAGAEALECLSLSSSAHVLPCCSTGRWCFCLFCLSYHSDYNDQAWLAQTGCGFVVLHPSTPKWWGYRHKVPSLERAAWCSVLSLFCFTFPLVLYGLEVKKRQGPSCMLEHIPEGRTTPAFPSVRLPNIWHFSFSRAATWMQAWSWKSQLSVPWCTLESCRKLFKAYFIFINMHISVCVHAHVWQSIG